MGIFDGYLLMSDIDGTFENRNNRCPQKNVDAICYFTKNGGLFSFATGRLSAHLIRNGFDRLTNAPCCLSNGSLVYDFETDEFLYKYAVPHTVRDIVGKIKTHLKVPVRYSAPIDSVSEHKSVDIDTIPCDIADAYPSKFIIFFEYEEDAVAFENAARSDPYFSDCFVCRSWNTGVEILNGKATKGDALEFIKEYCGCHTAVAIGDYGNDFTMLEAADIAAAVECEYDGLKGIADIITCKCTDGAVADLIYKLEERINNR